MKVEIRKTQEGDIIEIFHEPGNSRDLLESAIKESVETWTGLINGTVIAIWGVIAPNLFSDDVYVWLTGSALIESNRFTFLRWSHEALKTLSAYPKLHGMVLCDFELSKKWLKWLGFTLEPMNSKVCKFSRG